MFMDGEEALLRLAGPFRILVMGCGDRDGDNGLGPALAEAVGRLHLPGVSVECAGELSIEHASMVADHDIVIFACAGLDGTSSFTFKRIGTGLDRLSSREAPGTRSPARTKNTPASQKPALKRATGAPAFIRACLEPADLVELGHRLFQRRPQGYVLTIRGFECDGPGEVLSAPARVNLAKAVDFLEAAIRLKLAA